MLPQLHVISTGEQSDEQLIKRVNKIIQHIDYIHIREKRWTKDQIYAAVMQLIHIGVPREKIIINSAVEIAIDTGVKGVHLPACRNDVARLKEQYPEITIGSSVHSLKEAVAKEQAGADFIMYGHVFPSDSKPNKPSRGIRSLQSVLRHVNIPVIAIGGITPNVTRSVLQTGAGGIAVLSGILKAKDVELAVRQYKQVME